MPYTTFNYLYRLSFIGKDNDHNFKSILSETNMFDFDRQVVA